jgi:hypothetical protein
MVQFSSNNFGKEENYLKEIKTSEKDVQTQGNYCEPKNKFNKLDLDFIRKKFKENKDSKLMNVKFPLVESKNVSITFSIKKSQLSTERNERYLNFYEKIIAKSLRRKSPHKKPNFSYLKTENLEIKNLPTLSFSNDQFFSERTQRDSQNNKYLDVLNNSKSNSNLLSPVNSQLSIRNNSKLLFSNKIVNRNIISKLTDKISNQKSILKESQVQNLKLHSLNLIQYRKNDFMKKMKELEERKEKLKQIMKLKSH